MLKSVYEKWDDLKKISVEENKEYIISYYLGQDSKIKIYFCCLNYKLGIYIEFTKESLINLNLPKLNGMDIQLAENHHINPGMKYICIQNISENEEIFQAFSSSLVDNIIYAKTYYEGYEIFKSIVKEYKDYFSNANRQLTKIEEQGLCAELLELHNLIQTKGDSIIYNWQGPSKNKRDFVFDNVSLEIKSTSNQEDPSVYISNENQLDVSFPMKLSKLFLKVYIMEEIDQGYSVNSCIDSILNSLISIQAKEAFIANLIKLKIDYKNYKAKYHFSTQKEYVYLINDVFPSITKEDIDPAIFAVSYRLKISHLEKYEIKEDEMNGQLF